MPVLSVKQVPLGARLAEDVYTSLGGLLFPQGTIITRKELEILQAFLVQEVEVEVEQAESDTARAKPGKKMTKKDKFSAKAPSTESGFDERYRQAVAEFRQLWYQVQGGEGIQVLKVRETITPLLTYVIEQPSLMLALGKTEKANDYLFHHAVAVGLISYSIARWMSIPEREWMQIALAGTLMDIGKTRIDPKILWKPGELTPEEFEEMKRHTMHGYRLIKKAAGLNSGVALAALQHHEREDGSGYPFGLTGKSLHTYSKIVAVADVFHAMSSERVYRKAASPYVVVEQLLQDSFGKLDPSIVLTFVNGISRFSVGTVVELSDGTIGKIVFTNQHAPTRPMVETSGRIVNLLKERNVSIVRVVTS